ncbi:hypothetical protein Tco_0738790 [Tanacetum coccineum]
MTMDHYTKNALWIYWVRGDDEVELTDEESPDNDDEDEVAEIFRIDTNTYDDYKDDWIYKWDKDIPWVHEKPLTNNGVWKEPTPVEHCCEPFLFKKDIQNGQPIAGKMMDVTPPKMCHSGNMSGSVTS